MPLSNAELALELEATVDGWQAFVNSIKVWSLDQTDTVSWEDPLGGPDIVTDTLWRIKEDYAALTGSEWAITPEDVLVPTGNMIDQYSALHYSIKAGDSATAASTSETNAAASESAASASAANALSSENAAAASETAAAGSEVVTAQNVTTASRYATELEDVIVLTGAGLSTGDYSALHYSAKSAGFAGTAETARDVALSWVGVSYNWAQYPEDVLVPQGDMATEYSAYHWAQKAALSGGALNPTPSSDGTDYAFGDGVWTNSPTFVGFTSAVANTVAGPTIQQGAAVAPDATKYGLSLTSDTDFQAILSVRGPALSRKGVIIGDSADNWRAGMWVHNNDDVEYWGPHYASILFDKGVSSSAIRFNTATSEERMRILESGYVGIGTTAPGALFHVYEDAAATAAAARVESATGNATLEVHAGDTNADSASLQLSQGGGTPWTDSCEVTQAYDNMYLQSRHATGAMIFQTNSTEWMRITSGGDVGIGKASPSAELHISRGAGVRTQLWMDGNIVDQFKINVNVDESVAILNSSTTGPLTLGANGSEAVRIGANGFVGIGDTSPTRALNVVGANNCVANIRGTTANGYLSFSSSGTTNDTQVAIGANGDDMRLLAGGSERARIASTGRFGVGTTTPDYAFEANGSIDNSAIAFGASPEIGINVSNSSGVSLGTHADLLFRVSTVGKSGISGIYEGYDVAGLGTALGFHTAETANGNVMAEKMRLTNQGTLGIGTTAPVCVGLHIIAIDSSVKTPTTNSATHPLCIQREQNCVVAIRAGSPYQSRIEFGGTAANYGRLARIACATDDANLIFETGGGNSIASSEVARLTATGELGIGMTAPPGKLGLYAANGTSNRLSFHNAATGETSLDGFEIGQTTGSPYLDALIWQREAGAIRFATSGVERGRWAADGKFGVNYSNPQRAAHVHGTGHSGALMLSGNTTDNTLTWASAGIVNYNTLRANISDAVNYGMILGIGATDKFYFASSGFGMAEQASAPSTTAGQGYLWVKNTTPCQLWFTDDAGTSTQIV